MFVDRVTIYCQAGDGGSGCLSFRREAHVPRGGPNGGDGGKGGDVIVVADENATSLANLVGHKHWRGGRGEHGLGSLMTGRGGEDAVILVPPGTLVRQTCSGSTPGPAATVVHNLNGMPTVSCYSTIASATRTLPSREPWAKASRTSTTGKGWRSSARLSIQVG